MQLHKLVNQWDKRGFYQVGTEKYYNKLEAIQASNRTGLFPEWNFNNSVFGAVDWQTEPHETLTELYRQRAQQLRENYDYIVLFYSSGADSTNVLQSFLFNNIPIDELFVFGNFEKDRTTYDLDRKPGNYNAELYNVGLPYLRELSKTYKFKFTQHDWTTDVMNGYKNTDWIWSAGARFQPNVVARNRFHDMTREHLNLYDRDYKVAFVYGAEKPRIIYRDGHYYIGFLDVMPSTSIGSIGQVNQHTWEHDEYFYWTPDLPKMLVKQAHILMRYFKQNPQDLSLIENADKASWHTEKYYELINPMIYAGWKRDIFQVKKPTSPTFNELDKWFLDSDTPERKIWLEGLREVEQIVGEKWLNGGTISKGLMGNWSKFYQLSK
jgi:hypothetical protein